MTAKQYNSKIDKYEKEIKKIQNELLIKYKKIIETEVKELCLDAVSDFYSDYDPIFYNRKMDLKNAFKVIVDIDEGTFEIKFDGSLMKKKHRAENDYIFEIGFMRGWHGGADRIDDSKIEEWGEHPDPGEGDELGTPYWRTPHPRMTPKGETPYLDWGRPAEISEAPYDVIMKKMPVLESNLNDRMNKEYTKRMKPIISGIEKLFHEFNG